MAWPCQLAGDITRLTKPYRSEAERRRGRVGIFYTEQRTQLTLNGVVVLLLSPQSNCCCLQITLLATEPSFSENPDKYFALVAPTVPHLPWKQKLNWPAINRRKILRCEH